MKFWVTTVAINSTVDIVSLAKTEEEARERVMEHITAWGIDREDLSIVEVKLDPTWLTQCD